MVSLTESSDCGKIGINSLELLRHFSFLRRFQVGVFELSDFRGLRHLTENLEYLGLGQTRYRRFSLAELERFKNLREIYISNPRP